VEEGPFDCGPVRLNVARSGPPSAPPVVLLHGVTRRWQDYLAIWPWLAGRWSVHAIDFRGHGGSGRTPGAYRVVDYVPDVVAYLRDALDGPAVLLGHSLGGMVAAAASAAVPACVRAVVLEDPTFDMTGVRIGETGFPDLFRAFRAHAGSDRPVGEIARELAEARVSVPGANRSVRLGEVRDAASLRFSAACLKRLDPDVLTTPLEGRWLDGLDVAGTLRRVACPALLLRGEFALGGALPDDYAAELAAMVRDCVQLKMPDVGHNIHGTAAGAMMTHVLNFLGSIE
jgi:pimeloyl-ACP methyl ester carboxylesterase